MKVPGGRSSICASEGLGTARGACLTLSQQKWTPIVPQAQLPAEARVLLSAMRVSMCVGAVAVGGVMLAFQLVEEKHPGLGYSRSHCKADLCLGRNESFTLRFYLSFQ